MTANQIEGLSNPTAEVSSTPRPQSELDNERKAQIGAQFFGALAQITMALMAAPRYRHQSLGDLEHLVLEPLARDRIAIVFGKQENAPGQGQAIGMAFSARVSPEVDRKIKEQIAAGVFPVRLKPEEWSSGDIFWLLDVIAPTRELSTAVLAAFGRISKDNRVSIHPVVRSAVDPEFLRKFATSEQKASGSSPN